MLSLNTDTGSTMRLAAVQAAPAFLDRDGSIAQAIDLISQAGAAGVNLIGFPEGFLPGHPGWVELLAFNSRTQALGQRLFLESIDVSGGDLDPVREACLRHAVHAVVGLCEKRSSTTGTLYNSQVHIGADGSIRLHRQKFVPTIGERVVHAPGTTRTDNSSHWEGGTVTSLICGENSHPMAQYVSALAYPTVHVAAWPQHFSPELAMREAIRVASRGLAYSLKCFVINAVTTISEEMISAYGVDGLEDYLRDDASSGRASIIGPAGDVLAEATGDDEQLVTVDVDPTAVVIPKMIHDVAGHYDRPDLWADVLR